MILYNVTVSIDPGIEKDWLRWMREIHIPDVMATRLFVDHKIFRLINEVEGGRTYAIQYFALDINDIDAYLRDHAPRLRQMVTDRYGEKALSFRTLMEQVI
ncbi:DUF4286 family protein [Cesiribacter andamanensis]|uniref:DUF4286 domain-containing protein n=1 Tax=Cesiribacter andamanensis AMV16 TaxID=1279009 RepID=M7NTJ9_9BACT|nr:DUF4286 family protein [Cesiribacter andamanensis]EMR01774.1 hypothetical protein ADICEAN_03094 [Cesiribacter andamanensis AMV16]